MGDPVRGVSTPFLESLDTVGGSKVIFNATSTKGPGGGTNVNASEIGYLNHFLTPTEFQDAVQRSYYLTEPLLAKDRDLADVAAEEAAKTAHEQAHANAAAALARIVSLENANSKDRTRANIVRCIETFGRHRTDGVLRPRAPTQDVIDGAVKPEKTPRAGPDTGSSEVQIAILTAKIRVLADQLETKSGGKDKVNKRNLRLMVHRRQKLLKYLKRKERGSDRWEKLITTLGLTEGTWEGEISL